MNNKILITNGIYFALVGASASASLRLGLTEPHLGQLVFLHLLN